MATADLPASPGSLLVSPVDPSLVANLTHVGARDANGLPTAAAGVNTLVTRAYDLLAAQPLRDALIFDPFATVRPTRQSHNGAVVRMSFIDDITDDPATAALAEDYDVIPTPLKAYHTEIVMKEYGRVITTTNLLRGTSQIPVDPVAAERIGRNAGSTLDRLAIAALEAAGGVKADGTAGAVPVDVGVAGKPSDSLRAAAEYFQEHKVEPFSNGLYLAVITPAEETALRREADAAGWRYWQANNSANGVEDVARRGSVVLGGNPKVFQYEGFMIVPSIRVQQGLFLGNEGLAKAYPIVPGFGPTPQTIVSPVVDRLRRFASVGWTWTGGYARYRAEATCTADLSAVTP